MPGFSLFPSDPALTSRAVCGAPARYKAGLPSTGAGTGQGHGLYTFGHDHWTLKPHQHDVIVVGFGVVVGVDNRLDDPTALLRAAGEAPVVDT